MPSFTERSKIELDGTISAICIWMTGRVLRFRKNQIPILQKIVEETYEA